MAVLEIGELQKLIPHRYPFLLVDRILELEPGVRAKGLKNVTSGESFFQGHFPGMPIMPGVLIIEAIAQTGAVILLSDPQFYGQLPVFGALDEVRFKRKVVPGDQLIMEAELLWFRSRVGRCRGRATVNGEVAVSGEMTFKILEREEA